jgi:hypothetical protein
LKKRTKKLLSVTGSTGFGRFEPRVCRKSLIENVHTGADRHRTFMAPGRVGSIWPKADWRLYGASPQQADVR